MQFLPSFYYIYSSIRSNIRIFSDRKRRSEPAEEGPKRVKGDESHIIRGYKPSPLSCLRDHTVAALWEQIQEVRVVHVRGTPSSGKSTLAGLLHMHVEKRGTKVIHFRWPGDLNAKAKTSSFSFALNKIIQEAGMTDQTWLSLENTLIIIDEAQVSYAYEDLWNKFIKPLVTSGNKFGPYVVLFTSYGSLMGRVVVPTLYQLTCHQ